MFGLIYLHRCSKNVNDLFELFCGSGAVQFQTTTEALNLTSSSKSPIGISDWNFINVSFVSVRLGNQALEYMYYIFHLHYLINLSKPLYSKGSQISKVSTLQETAILPPMRPKPRLSIFLCGFVAMGSTYKINFSSLKVTCHT